jgi:hypothetical protein
MVHHALGVSSSGLGPSASSGIRFSGRRFDSFCACVSSRDDSFRILVTGELPSSSLVGTWRGEREMCPWAISKYFGD